MPALLGAFTGWLQSTDKAHAVVKIGRFLYVATFGLVGGAWYTGWRNERVQKGDWTFPIPGVSKLKAQFSASQPDAPPPPSFAPSGGLPGAGGTPGDTVGSTPFGPPAASGPLASRIIQIAQSQIGFHEGPGNRNRYGPSEPWCALFATWVWRRAGIHIPQMGLAAGPMDWARGRGLFHTTNPRPGDFVHYGRQHIGIVETVRGPIITTIEGNYSNKVAHRGPFNWHSENSPAPIVGFVSPPSR